MAAANIKEIIKNADFCSAYFDVCCTFCIMPRPPEAVIAAIIKGINALLLAALSCFFAESRITAITITNLIRFSKVKFSCQNKAPDTVGSTKPIEYMTEQMDVLPNRKANVKHHCDNISKMPYIMPYMTVNVDMLAAAPKLKITSNNAAQPKRTVWDRKKSELSFASAAVFLDVIFLPADKKPIAVNREELYSSDIAPNDLCKFIA